MFDKSRAPGRQWRISLSHVKRLIIRDERSFLDIQPLTPQIGFVFSNSLSSSFSMNYEQRTTNHNIGFDWLCFFVPRRTAYCHNSLPNKMLSQFIPAKIGFVFSNRILSDTDSHRLTLIFLSVIPAKAGIHFAFDPEYNIGFVWVCFHQVSNPIYFS